MQSETLKIITIMFCCLFGITWMIISIRAGAMYEPPTSLQVFLVALISGKYADSVAGRNRQQLAARV